MKTGLFFGSFNPIHTGHLIIAQYLINEAKLDRVKFIVSPHNPLKTKEELIPQDLRLKMVELSVYDNPQFEVDTIEFNMPLPSYTFKTLEILKALNSNDELFIMMGSDSLENIHLWKNYEQIMEYPILIYKRDKTFVNPFPEKSNLNIFDSPILNISATGIRNMLTKKQSVKYLVRDEILSVLEKEL